MCKAQIKAKIRIIVLKEMLEIAKTKHNKARTTDLFLSRICLIFQNLMQAN